MGQTKPNTMSAALGAIIVIGANVASNVGTNTQKAAHIRNGKKKEEDQVAYWKLPLWWCGFVGVLSGAIGDFVALALATQSMVAALGGSTTLVANVIVSHYWHHDTI